MAGNPLYYFIKNVSFYESIAKINQFYRAKKDAFDTPYFLFDLTHNMGQSIEGTEYTLVEHHVSVYSNRRILNTNVGNYHYTAIIKDANENLYRLHVYFNEKDKIIGAPELSMTIEADEISINEKIELSQNLNDIFHRYAVHASSDIVKELRSGQHLLLEHIRKKYTDSLTALDTLAKTFDDKKQEYLEKISETIPYLKLCIQLENISSLLSKQLTFFMKFKKDMEAERINLDFHESTQLTIEEDNHLSEALVDLPVSEFFVNVKETSKKLKGYWLSSADNVCKAKEKLMQSAQGENITIEEEYSLFMAYNQNVELLQDGYLSFSAKNISDKALFLQSHLLHRTQKGVSLLTRLLLQEKYDLAKELIFFLDEAIAVNFLKLGLKRNNAVLVDFLLSNTAFALNTTPLTFPEGSFLALQYCYQQSLQQNNDAIFRILLKHKASLFVGAKDGLPLLHHILSNRDHSFGKILAEGNKDPDSEKRLCEDAIFYLESCLKRNEYDFITQNKINGIIASYRESQKKSLLDQNLLQDLKPNIVQMWNNVCYDKHLQEIAQNPLFIQKWTLLNFAVVAYEDMLKAQSVKEKNSTILQIKNNITEAAKDTGSFFDKLNESFLKKASLEDMCEIIERLTTNINYQTERIQLDQKVKNQHNKKQLKQINNKTKRLENKIKQNYENLAEVMQGFELTEKKPAIKAICKVLDEIKSGVAQHQAILKKAADQQNELFNKWANIRENSQADSIDASSFMSSITNYHATLGAIIQMGTQTIPLDPQDDTAEQDKNRSLKPFSP